MVIFKQVLSQLTMQSVVSASTSHWCLPESESAEPIADGDKDNSLTDKVIDDG